MSLETNIGNAVTTFFAGMTLSLTDRLFSKNSKRFTDGRVKEKLEQVEAMDYLIEAEKSENRTETVSSRDYHNAIAKAREYFGDSGQYKSTGLIRKFAEKIGGYSKSPELINNLKSSKKFALAMGIEFLYDAITLGFQTIAGIGHFGKAFAHSLYQGPALFAGMLAGKGILYVKDWTTKTKEEKEYDSMTRELTADGKLLEIIRNYSPTAKLKVESRVIEPGTEQLPVKIDSSSLGERVGTTISDTAEGIGKNVMAGIDVIKQRLEQRKKSEEEAGKERKDKLRKSYEDY